jgi:hypothetical protein
MRPDVPARLDRPSVIPLNTPLAFDRRRAEVRNGEPWGARLWIGAGLVLVIALLLQSYGITTWPMADDEVPSLVELDILHSGADKFLSVPPSQIHRLAQATVVWNTFQRHAIALLPQTSELGHRLPSLVCGVLAAILAFVFAARARGLWFGTALALLVNTSHTFVYLSPLNRFYGLPMLLLTLTLGALWLPGGGAAMLAVVAVLSALTVLGHNIVLPIFVMAFGAAAFLYVVGRASLPLVMRTGVAAGTSVAIYLLYLLPIVRGWASTGNPTPVLVSFAAHATVPALALAMFGGWLALIRPDQGDSMLWWLLIFAGSFVCFQFAPVMWNPRYFVFYMAAMWVLGAHGMEFVARRIGFGTLGAVWYAAVVILMLPFLVSHFQDGSRHDYRAAAAILKTHAQPGELLLSDDAETISYYLPPEMIANLQVRTRVTVFPSAEFLVVYRGNAWAGVPQIPGRQMELLGELYKRRFDQFSHILRVYRVAPKGAA